MSKIGLAIVSFIFCATMQAQNNNNYRLVWQDEFNYTGLPNNKKWSYDIGGHGWGNKELQYYTNANKNNAYVANGVLTITLLKQVLDSNQYTSAKLTTKNKAAWQYGKIEVRAKLPKGKGTWPAIWMMPYKAQANWPACGEIDIMEHVGYDENKVHATIHCAAYNHKINTQKNANVFIASATDSFHLYTMEWTANEIKVAIDGKEFYNFKNDNTGNNNTWPFNKPFYLIMNIAMGGDWGGKNGIDSTLQKAEMQIDYVRVYQQQ
jgi:beta-glucanase (GH16 family)